MSVKSPPQNTSLQVTALLRPHFCCDCDIVKYFPRCRCDCTAIRQHFNRRCTFVSRRYYSPTGRGTTVLSVSVCVSVYVGLCSSGRTYISGITCPNFTKLSMLLTTLVFLWRHFDTLCTSFFIFTVRCYASAVLDMALCLSVRLCVTSRCYRVLLKRLNVGSHK